MMRKWSPLFIPAEAPMNKVITWVWITELPREYYNDDGLFAIANCVGSPIRIDRQTSFLGYAWQICLSMCGARRKHAITVGLSHIGEWKGLGAVYKCERKSHLLS
ncbi:hypothetical protein LINGRAHAP2_LOCUS27183 [Linum grandiflorum]